MNDTTLMEMSPSDFMGYIEKALNNLRYEGCQLSLTILMGVISKSAIFDKVIDLENKIGSLLTEVEGYRFVTWG